MNWLNKIIPQQFYTISNKKSVPENIWYKCPACKYILYRPNLLKNMMVCKNCSYHMRLTARQRAKIFLDNRNIKEYFINIKPKDILKFQDIKSYKERLLQAQDKTKENDALLVFEGTIHDISIITAIFDFNFLGGSMGSVVGEKFLRAVDLAIKKKLPFICFTASGGARMQESLFSLMQMAKTSTMLAKLSKFKLPYIVVMTDPTTGGVSASIAMLGDINIAEPNALIGFAGARVIQQTVGEKLPKGFQRSEFLLEKGMIDMIIHRQNLSKEISNLLIKLMHRRKITKINP